MKYNKSAIRLRIIGILMQHNLLEVGNIDKVLDEICQFIDELIAKK